MYNRGIVSEDMQLHKGAKKALKRMNDMKADSEKAVTASATSKDDEDESFKKDRVDALKSASIGISVLAGLSIFRKVVMKV